MSQVQILAPLLSEIQEMRNGVDPIHSLAILIADSKTGTIFTLIELNGAIITQSHHSESPTDYLKITDYCMSTNHKGNHISISTKHYHTFSLIIVGNVQWIMDTIAHQHLFFKTITVVCP